MGKSLRGIKEACVELSRFENTGDRTVNIISAGIETEVVGLAVGEESGCSLHKKRVNV